MEGVYCGAELTQPVSGLSSEQNLFWIIYMEPAMYTDSPYELINEINTFRNQEGKYHLYWIQMLTNYFCVLLHSYIFILLTYENFKETY